MNIAIFDWGEIGDFHEMGDSGESCASSNSDECVHSGRIRKDDESHHFYKSVHSGGIREDDESYHFYISGDSCLYSDSGD